VYKICHWAGLWHAMIRAAASAWRPIPSIPNGGGKLRGTQDKNHIDLSDEVRSTNEVAQRRAGSGGGTATRVEAEMASLG
jgi:hypothetical protein